MKILAIDPGTTESAYMVYDGKPESFGKVLNETLLMQIGNLSKDCNLTAIETIQNYGMQMGRETILTLLWTGRFIEKLAAYMQTPKLIARPTVKNYITGRTTSKDSDVRRALMQKHGGTKKGEPLYGIYNDVWAVFAVAEYVNEAVKNGDLREW